MGWWAASTDRKMIGHVTMSGYVPINYQLPFSYANRGGRIRRPTITPTLRARTSTCGCAAFGSCHPGGANFCFADGNVQFLASATDLGLLRALCTRAKGDNTQ